MHRAAFRPQRYFGFPGCAADMHHRFLTLLIVQTPKIKDPTMKIKGIIITVLTAFVLTLACCSSCTRIDAGYEGIKVKQYGTGKGVQDISLVTGRVWYNPFTEDIHQFPVFVQTADYEPFSVNAKDGSVFSVDPTITFKVITGHSP